MIHRILFLIACVLILYPAYSQSGYNVAIGPGMSCRIHSIGFGSADRISISGIITPMKGGPQQIYIATLDTLADIIEWTVIESPDLITPLTTNPETGMFVQEQVVALPFNFLGRNSLGLAIVDSTVTASLFEFPQDSVVNVIIPQDIVGVTNGYIICGNIQFTNYNVDAFVLKVSLSGDVIWRKVFGHPLYWENARSIAMAMENEFVVSGTRYQWEFSPEFYHGWAYAMDSLGNKKWEWEADEEEIPHRGIMSMEYDTIAREWVYVSFLERKTTYPGQNYDVMIPVLVRRDSTMALISYEEYGPHAVNHYMADLIPARNGGWIAAGNSTRTTDEFLSPIRTQSGRVIKLAGNGDLEWSVIDTAFFHPELGSRSYLSGVTESPTGSIYAAGWADHPDDQGTHRSFGWLLKITADGCVDTLCTTTSLLEQLQDRKRSVKVYPNPASDYVVFEVDDLLTGTLVQVFDIHGRLVEKKALDSRVNVVLLDAGSCLPGIYAWSLTETNGNIVHSGKFVVRQD